ncbi:MAG: alanyl-tRNA editing protein [Candidatus Bathyarchaeota archaeon]|nr:alanyl-tRNA editing protein [Candidatus Bathyarchaeota archaeon]
MVASDEVRGHTAIHVLKGAVVHVLGRGAKWSASAYSQGAHGGLTVQFDRKPTDEEMQGIEEAVNRKIGEDAPTEVHEMARSDAEARWGDDIYDLFPLPAELKVVKVFHLPGWNVNTCGKQHCAKTGEVGGIKIVKWRYRANKQLLEMSFDVTGINGSG